MAYLDQTALRVNTKGIMNLNAAKAFSTTVCAISAARRNHRPVASHDVLPGREVIVEQGRLTICISIARTDARFVCSSDVG